MGFNNHEMGEIWDLATVIQGFYTHETGKQGNISNDFPKTCEDDKIGEFCTGKCEKSQWTMGMKQP